MNSTYRSVLAPTLPTHPGERVRWGSLYASGNGLALACAARIGGKPLLVVTRDAHSAQRLEQELRFYLEPDAHCPLLVFPDRETLPYDVFSPHQDIVSQRLEVLHRLPLLRSGVVLATVSSAMHRLAPRSFLEARTFLLSAGDRLEVETFRRRLEAVGYRCVGQVFEHGEFAVRGGLLDLFPMGSSVPYRIELFDEEVETIRTFDHETQRSTGTVDEIRLLPAREFPMDEAGTAQFRRAWRATFEGDPQACPVYQAVSDGIAPSGVEYYLPLFLDQTGHLFDYLPADCVWVALEGVEAAADQFWREVKGRYESRRHDRLRPLVDPRLLFLQPNEILGFARAMPQAHIREEPHGTGGGDDLPTAAPPQLEVTSRGHRPLQPLQEFLCRFPGRVLLAAESTGRREVLLELLATHGLQPKTVAGWQDFLDCEAPLAIAVAPLEHGLLVEQPSLAVITENQLFGQRAAQPRSRQRPPRDPDLLIRDLTELASGAPVLHEEHGVGRYLGLQMLERDGQPAEFLLLEYAGGDKLYVPVRSLHLIRRYTGAAPEQAPLHRLGSGQWEKAKRRAAERVYDVAAELLDIYARRAARPGHSFRVDAENYRAFAEAFPFEETPDQERAIQSVLDDLHSPRPTDRLVCGDVGFGKTEVALRAAFVAVHDGKQVAVLVPTTLLAQQHFQTFLDRFADWPVRIENLSRFRSRSQQQAVLHGLERGTVDIVVGTHRLLSPDVRFHRLGLVIVDEEHRFGVRHKERLKALRAEADTLTLTATPIPRTLNMALSGLREISLIATAPARRLAIKTFVREWDDGLIREAVLRELLRGGQVYFLHNRVEDIEHFAERVQGLVPEARIAVAHGQMRERDLERVMLDFYHQRFNLLVCTTIIESGIDVPTANTILIHRADRFGLAQLHQLRGRVGRSHHQAYAYLLAPPRQALTADAAKRLEAIESLEDLGSGFLLATHDLEIRGAGELLGEEQSGQIENIGFSLYMEYLERAVQALKSGRHPDLDRPAVLQTDIDLHIPALLPQDYVPDVQLRLVMYKRIASAPSEEALRELQVEMIDRFGLLPAAAKNLIQLAELKLGASRLGIRKIDLGPQGGRVLFQPDPPLDPMAVVRLVQGEPRTYRLDGADALRISKSLDGASSRLTMVERLLDTLAAPAPQAHSGTAARR